jgi:hypothetical protein
MKHALLLLSAVALVTSATAIAQAPDFSGWFRLNKAASHVTAGVGLAGLGQGGAPHTLYITDAANGTITIGSDINESQSRLYRLNGESPLAAARGGPVAVKTRRDGRAIVAEGAGLKEMLSLSADGQTLTISVSVTTAAGPGASTLVYTRMQGAAEPCTDWPTPCRRK